jgi:hypothetical protein
VRKSPLGLEPPQLARVSQLCQMTLLRVIMDRLLIDVCSGDARDTPRDDHTCRQDQTSIEYALTVDYANSQSATPDRQD